MDKYIRQINKLLTCHKNQKKRIINELKSNIMIALENGEEWSSIEKRLGDPNDFVREFNESYGKVEKSNKKLVIGLVTGCFIVIALFLGYQYLSTPKIKPLNDSKVFKSSQVLDSSKQVILYLYERDYQGLESMYSSVLENELDNNQLSKAVESLGELGTLNKYDDYEFIEIHDQNGISAVGEIVVVYDKRTVIYRISFDEEMKLNGLYMR